MFTHLGCLFKFHDKPITYLYNTFFYYESSLRGRRELRQLIVMLVHQALKVGSLFFYWNIHYRTLYAYLSINKPIYLSFIHLSIYLPGYLSIFLSTYMYIFDFLPVVYFSILYVQIFNYISMHLSINQSISLSTNQSINLSFYPSIYLSIHPSTYLSIYLPIYPSTYISIYLSIYLGGASS